MSEAKTDIDPNVRVDVPALLDQKNLPHALQLYSLLFVSIDGSLQAEEQKVDVRIGPERTRVYMRCAVPANGFELNARDRVGDQFNVAVFGPSGDVIVARNMTLKHFACSHEINKIAVARYIFEAPARDQN